MVGGARSAPARRATSRTATGSTVNVGGPIFPNKLFFYGSYYRPRTPRENRANLYGELPDYESTRNEGFGKLTFTPTSSVLLNVSYRDSHRLDTSDLFAVDRLGDDRHRQRGAAEDRHRRGLVGRSTRAAT